MIRRSCLVLAATGLALGVTERALAAPQPRTQAKPNIIFVLADDLGYGDLGCYGGSSNVSPNLDRLAREGLRFTQFYANSPLCSPSRVAFTTGQYPARWGITSWFNTREDNRRRGMAQWLDVKAPTLAHALSGAGYLTGHFGKWHMGGGHDVGDSPLPTEYGFSESLTQFDGLGDRVLPVLSEQSGQPGKMKLGLSSESLGRGVVRWEDRSKVTGAFVSRALNFIQKAEKTGKPFYLNLWPDDAHNPQDPPANLRGDGSIKALHRGVLSSMDAQLGPLFDAIRSSPKLRDNTLILFSSDNGPEPNIGSTGGLRGHKANLYEGGIREPFIVWGPRLLAANRRGAANTTAVLSAVDVVPSLLKLAGAGSLPGGDGQDVSAALLGQKPTGRVAPLFWRRPPDRPGPSNAPLPDLAVREGDWKLLCAEDGSRAQLYNLAQDESEAKNLAADNPQVLARLKEKLLLWNKTLPPSPKATPPTTATRFELRGGQHLDQNEAPQIASRGFRVQAKFEAQAAQGGVLVAQGGFTNGYSLLAGDGVLTFFVRQDGKIFSVQAPLGVGAHSAVASLGSDGTFTLALDGQPEVQGKAPGAITRNPAEGLDVGSDQASSVGSYPVPSRFTGTISSVTIVLAGTE